jgi:hypothetical protein
MKYVLDASAGIKWVMNEIDSADARQLRDNFRMWWDLPDRDVIGRSQPYHYKWVGLGYLTRSPGSCADEDHCRRDDLLG